MTSYAARRLSDLVFVLFGVSLLIFLMLRMIPGDAVMIMLGANVDITPERVEALRRSLGLHLPWHEKYVQWLGGVLRGDLGRSIWTDRPVLDEILARLPVTLQLTGIALVMAIVVSFTVGVLSAPVRHRLGGQPLSRGAARHRGGAADDRRPQRDPPLQPARRPQPRLHPHRPHQGPLTPQAGLKHALRNAMIPVVTVIGVQVSYLLSGVVVIEQVFAIPGLGRLVIGAISERNYPLVQGVILDVTAVFVFVNLIVDLTYTWIDPWVEYV